MKKLYHVRVESDYYCTAENEIEATDMCEDVMRDLFDPYSATASEVTSNDKKYIDKDWLNGLLYGEDRDITLRAYLDERAQEEEEKKKQAELEAKQMKLF